jgi:hypothetical protein
LQKLVASAVLCASNRLKKFQFSLGSRSASTEARLFGTLPFKIQVGYADCTGKCETTFALLVA